jgi:hypothetical protein
MLHTLWSEHISIHENFVDADLLQDDYDEIYPLDNVDTIFIMPEIHDDHVALEGWSDMQKNEELDENMSDMTDSIFVFDNQTMNHSGLCILDQVMTSDVHDDITPVPHELINEVKKAQKKKQKLDRKNKKKFLQIFKKK